MFNREILKYLNQWRTKERRKPLIIRGARQVGKTVAVELFAAEYFENLIVLNLEKEEVQSFFQQIIPISELIQLIQLKTGEKIIPGKTLLFIDEIQNSSIAMTQLRYFYEEMPNLHVIAAGSLLEVKIEQEGLSIPVGRVEYCYMYPVTFDEFIKAKKDKETSNFLASINFDSRISDSMYDVLSKKYNEYLIVGGMPEAVDEYIKQSSFINLDPIYESIITGYRDDVFKYASKAKGQYIQHVIENSPIYAGKIIKYEKFAGSGYRSREMKEAFDIAEKAMIVTRVSPSSSIKSPIIRNFRKSSKLLFLDTGLVNYRLGIRDEILSNRDLNSIYQGQVAEQIVGQSLQTFTHLKKMDFAFWYRDRGSSIAEIDYIVPFNQHLVPIEVKSGKTGRLKSLHLFMAESQQPLAIRVYSGMLKVQKIQTTYNQSFMLLSVPFYLLDRLKSIVEEMI